MKICHTHAMKMIKELEEQKRLLIEKEDENCIVSYKEGEARLPAGYDYDKMREEIRSVDGRVRSLRAVLAKANCTVTVEPFGHYHRRSAGHACAAAGGARADRKPCRPQTGLPPHHVERRCGVLRMRVRRLPRRRRRKGAARKDCRIADGDRPGESTITSKSDQTFRGKRQAYLHASWPISTHGEIP